MIRALFFLIFFFPCQKVHQSVQNGSGPGVRHNDGERKKIHKTAAKHKRETSKMAGRVSTLEGAFGSARSEQTEVKQHLQTAIASSTSEPFHAAWMIFSRSVIRKSHFIHFHHLNVPCRAAIDIAVEEVMSPGCNYNRKGSQPSGRGGRGGGGTNAHGVM